MYSASRICERSPPLFLRRIVVSRLRRIRLRRKYLIPKPVLSLHAASLHNSSKLITRSRELRSLSRERIISYVMQTSWLAWMSCPTCARRRLAFFKRGARGMPGGGSVTACDPAASAPLPLLRRGVLSLWLPVAALIVNAAPSAHQCGFRFAHLIISLHPSKRMLAPRTFSLSARNRPGRYTRFF